MLTFNIPAPFSYGFSFYTVIDIPGGFVYAAIQSENRSKPRLWVFQVDLDDAFAIESYLSLSHDDLVPLEQLFSTAGVVKKITASFGEGSDTISIFKANGTVTITKSDDYLDIPPCAHEEFLQMLKAAKTVLAEEEEKDDSEWDTVL